MSFSYNVPTDDDAGRRDAIRFLLGDTNPQAPYLQDEEIDYVISKWWDKYKVVEMLAAVLADQIAARYASEASYSADGVSVSLGPVGDQFRTLGASLREQYRALLVGGSPDVGGVSPYEERSGNIRNFSFGTGMHDDLAAGPQDYGDRGSDFFPVEYYPGT